MEANLCDSQARDPSKAIGTLEHLVRAMHKKIASARQSEVLTDYPANFFPALRPRSSSSSNRLRSHTPRTSSEHSSFSSDETRRTSFTDEAQTSYNILLMLRTDTQHLITLRNENLAALEDRSALNEDDASSKTALLACINESITAATRSITQLGPFLDKHRWPAAGRPATPESQRRSLIITLKPPRRQQLRCKSSATPAAASSFSEDGESIFSPEELFSWTLALTAQHTAVLVATERLRTFIEYGIADVSEEEKRRRDARASWWEQGRGEFENVGLIQSLLRRPNRTFEETSAEEKARVAPDSTTAEPPQADGTGPAENLTPIMENDDGRSETMFSEDSTPLTLNSTPKGLTARPRQHRMGSLQQDEDLSVGRAFTEPLAYHSPGAHSSNEAKLSRMETFGSVKPAIPFSRFSSSKQGSRNTRSPLPSTIALQDTLSEQLGKTLEQGRQRSATTDLVLDGEYLSMLSVGGAPSLTRRRQFTAPFTPNASLEHHNASSIQFQQQLSPSPSPGVDTVYTPYKPYMPLDTDVTNLVTQRALTMPTSQNHQPEIQDLHHILKFPSQEAENIARRVSPIEAKSRMSIAPAIEGPDNIVVSPVEADESSTFAQQLLGVSPITITEAHERASQDGAEAHIAWLNYIERKQQVSASRWSLEWAKTR